MTDLQGRVVVVTGAARGIGAATARALAAAGARVVVVDLDLEPAQQVARSLPGATAMALDVTDHAQFTAVLDRVEREIGPLDALVNNAGIMVLGPLQDESDAVTTRQLAVNLGAVVHGTREAVRRMVPRGRGHIVNIASVAGRLGAAGGATYCASKHGVVGLSEAVRHELRGTGVHISCVMPTIVRTELAAGLRSTRLSSMVEAEDVAAAVVTTLATRRRPRHDVFVPGRLAAADRLMRLLPRPAAEAVLRWTGSDRLLAAGAHTPERAGYERRATGGTGAGPEARTAHPEGHMEGGVEGLRAVR